MTISLRQRATLDCSNGFWLLKGDGQGRGTSTWKSVKLHLIKVDLILSHGHLLAIACFQILTNFAIILMLFFFFFNSNES